jgi:phosphoribosyl 1,2-cyclic phosphodiesterase
MPMRFASLNSGSNGNCYYVSNEQSAVLIDAGLSCRETERRLLRLGLDIQSIKAIFISHEHNDHITGSIALAKKYNLPLYLTQGTKRHLNLPVDSVTHHVIQQHEVRKAGSLTVISFPKSHDAAEPVSFVVSDGQTHVGVFTDIGHCCNHVTHYFRQCHALFLESNYCDQMLEEGPYSATLKKRIRGKKGHLSNDQALELFTTHRPPQLSHLILSHLSQQNNTHKKVEDLFAPHAGPTHIEIASRYKETAVFEVEASGPGIRLLSPPSPETGNRQLLLFGDQD